MDRISTKKERRAAASTVLSRDDTAGISAKGDVGDELQVWDGQEEEAEVAKEGNFLSFGEFFFL